jgi:hypothetical protein
VEGGAAPTRCSSSQSETSRGLCTTALAILRARQGSTWRASTRSQVRGSRCRTISASRISSSAACVVRPSAAPSGAAASQDHDGMSGLSNPSGSDPQGPAHPPP